MTKVCGFYANSSCMAVVVHNLQYVLSYEEPSFIPFTKFIWILISCWGVHNVSTENDRNFTRNEIVLLLDPKIILRTRSMYWNTAVTTRIRGNFLLFFKRVIIEVHALMLGHY